MAVGKKTGGGSRKGVPNKVTKELKEMILGALDKAGGEDYLIQQAQENPNAFLTLLGKVIPKDLNIGGQENNPVSHKVIFEVISGNSASRKTN